MEPRLSSSAPYSSLRSGQAMILAVLALGGTILGATTIAGLLMTYQIRQATDFQNSAKSIFAADAGIEWSLYSYFQLASIPQPTFGNQASVVATCYDSSTPANVVGCNDIVNAAYVISKGTAGDTKRAFLLQFDQATTSVP